MCSNRIFLVNIFIQLFIFWWPAGMLLLHDIGVAPFKFLISIEHCEGFFIIASKQELVNIVSPLDDFWKKGKIDW